MHLTWTRETVGAILTFDLEQVEETRAIEVHMAEQERDRSILIPLLLLFMVYSLGAPVWLVAFLAIWYSGCLLYTSPSPRDQCLSRMPSSA